MSMRFRSSRLSARGWIEGSSCSGSTQHDQSPFRWSKAILKAQAAWDVVALHLPCWLAGDGRGGTSSRGQPDSAGKEGGRSPFKKR